MSSTNFGLCRRSSVLVVFLGVVRTENPIRVDDVMESPKLAE